jgi:hypothetical protein
MNESHEEYSEVVRELQEGESIRWTGRPALGLRMGRSDWLGLPGSLFFLAFAIFWNSGVWGPWGTDRHGSSPPLFFKLFGLPFLLYGAFLVFGRPFWEAYRRSRTYYGITGDRALIVTRLFARQTQSVLLRNLGETSVEEHGDGRGTIWLGPQPSFGDLMSGQFNRRNQTVTPRFEGVQAPRVVQQLLIMPRDVAGRRG